MTQETEAAAVNQQAAAGSPLASMTSCPLTIIDALVFAEQILGKSRVWQPSNHVQAAFLSYYFSRYRDLPAGQKEIESVASWCAATINEFLRRKGFNIQLDPFGPEEFGVASVLDLLVEWLDAGEVVTITTPDQKRYDGVSLKQFGMEFFRSPQHDQPIACVTTKNGDLVYMSMCGQPAPGTDLTIKVRSMMEILIPFHNFEGIHFPMVDHRAEVDISWLLGMNTQDEKGDPWLISQAKQENRLRMNQFGARAQSATAVGMLRMAVQVPLPPHIINRPFLVWFMRPGIELPLFVGYMTQADWKNPGDLSIT